MGRKPEEILKEAVFMLDVKLADKDEKGNVVLKAKSLSEIVQALRDLGYY